MSARSSHWSLTINNPSEADEECIAVARQKGWRVEGQKEVGENGTPHYQICLSTGQVRFSAVKAVFPRAHIEAARNVSALKKYVGKDDTRVGSLPEDGKYLSQSKFWSSVVDLIFKCEPPAATQGLRVLAYLNRIEEEWRRLKKLDRCDCTLHDYKQRWMLNDFDDAVGQLIGQGYYVESLGVNPQVRGAVKQYGEWIYIRELENIHRKEINAVDQESRASSRRSSSSSIDETSVDAS